MNYIHRNSDIITGENSLEHLHTFENFPVYMGCTNQPKSKDTTSNMSWWIGKNSGMIQLNPLLPLDIVYADEHGSGTVGELWNKHHKAFAEFVVKQRPNKVLEIGGLHGQLAKASLQLDTSLDWTIIEPNPCVDSDINVKVVRGWFDKHYTDINRYDAIVHSHVIEHLYEPEQFILDKSNFMTEGSMLIMSVPNLSAMLKQKFTNALNFEHTYFATEYYIEYLLCKHGFSVCDREYFNSDHSVFVCAKKTKTQAVAVTNYYEVNKALFLDYINYYTKLVKDLNSLIRSTDQPVYLFGAHIFSQYLLQFGLDESKIVCILDNDTNKQGLRLYGTDLTVQSPTTLAKIDKCLVILKVGFYKDEITKQLNSINTNIQYI